MTLDFGDLAAGMRLSGVVADADVTVVAVEMHGAGSATLTYKTVDGGLGERVVLVGDLAGLAEVVGRRWSFDADGAMFRLASEARRMRQAHLADPFAAVDTSNIDPYPHQIDAVYNRLLAQRPLRFLLADDPGAGKTIMSGLLIRELVLRGDVARCLIVAPGSLVEQWQDELWEKFGLSFDLMSRAAVEASRTGNPFTERNLLIARVDQLSRSDELMAKVQASDWDLVIVDEAHKMSAHRYGDELRRTGRFELGETLRERTRHLLLLTATPHNGKNEDFLAFMTLIDPERFAGRLRDGGGGGSGADTGGDGPAMPDVSDVMRRLVKENLRTFEGKRLFPQRHAHSLNFELSEPEAELYKEVTDYVRNGMNRAARMREEGDKSRGIIVGFALAGLQRRLASSPAAIYHSLRRRRDRLGDQAAELRRLAASGGPVPVIDLPKGVKIADLEDFDFDDYDDSEREDLEDVVIDAATAAGTAEELEAEVTELKELVKLADGVRRSGVDAKWLQLRGLLRSDRFAAGALSDSSDSGLDTSADSDSARKLIVFSEHKDTLDYVAERIESELGRPEAVVRIHRALLSEPADAGSQFVRLLASDFEQALHDGRVGEVWDFESVRSHVADTPLGGSPDQLAGRLTSNQRVPDDLKARDDIDLCRGAIVNGLVKIGMTDREVSRAVRDLASAVSDANSSNESLAVLMSSSSLGETPPRLELGVVLRSADGRYWLCVQPLCDSVRLEAVRAFPLLPLTLKPPRPAAMIRSPEGDTIPVGFESSPHRLAMPEFSPTHDGAVIADGDPLNWHFTSDDGAQYRAITRLRPEVAAQAVHSLASAASRAGADVSEWMRRGAPDAPVVDNADSGIGS